VINPYGVNIIGPVSLADWRRMQRLRPPLLVMMDAGRDELERAAAYCPDAHVVYRIYSPDRYIEELIMAGPVRAAELAHRHVERKIADLGPDWRELVTWFQWPNEVAQTEQQLDEHDQFNAAWMQRAEEAGYRLALLNCGVGWLDMPPQDRMRCWRRLPSTLQRCAQQVGHAIGVHQYGWPDLWGPAEQGGAEWLINRLEAQVLPRMPAGYDTIRWVVTEYGLDRALVGEFGGWAVRWTAAQYVDQLVRMAGWLRLNGWPERVVGYALYCLGSNGDPKWRSYDVSGEVLDRLADALGGQTGTVQPKPPAPNDTWYSQRDPRWARETLGSGPDTIGQSGCLITCVASALDPHWPPSLLNGWLKRNDGYYGMGFRFDSVERLGLDLVTLINCQTTPAPVGEIMFALRMHEVVIVQVDQRPGGAVQQHWVRLLDDRGTIMDPWRRPGDELTTLRDYCAPGWDYARAIYRVAIYRRANG
jgi:hypothetical protein